MAEIDESKQFFNELHELRVNLIKEVYEMLGDDYGKTSANISYHNYLISSGDALEIDSGDIIVPYAPEGYYGGSVPQSVGKRISSEETRANANVVMNKLMSDLGLTKEQAAGIAGVMTAESGINPAIFNKGEKNGTYKSSGANNLGTAYGTKHSPWSYGAGICQWTFCNRKEKAIMGGLGVSQEQAKKIIMEVGIEGLSLEQQIKMLEYELTTSYKYTLEGIKKCSSPAQAAATFYCHAIAGYSTSREPATQQEINSKNAAYSKVGASSQINKGMEYANGYM